MELAEEFLRRRDQLGNREYVARQVARSLYRKMELDWIQTTTLRSEDAIIYIVQTYRQKNALNED